MTGATLRAQVRCELLTDGVFCELPAPSSCGLDFWQSPAALNWLARFLDARPAVIRVTADSRSAALCCLLRRLPFNNFLASAYPYGMIGGDVDLFWQSGPEIVSVLRKQRVVRLEIPFTGEYACQLPQPDMNVKHVKLLDRLDAVRHVIDLEPARCDQEWLMRQLAHNTRKAIRKAGRSGCSVRQAVANDLGVVQSLYATSMRAKGAPVNYPAERFRGMIGELSSTGRAKVYLGQIGSRPAGVAAVVDGATSRHFIQLAVPPEMQWSCLSDLLVSAVIREAVVEGKRYFDFMASAMKDTGLIAYKAKWITKEEPIRYAGFQVIPLLGWGIDAVRWINARWDVSRFYMRQ